MKRRFAFLAYVLADRQRGRTFVLLAAAARTYPQFVIGDVFDVPP